MLRHVLIGLLFVIPLLLLLISAGAVVGFVIFTVYCLYCMINPWGILFIPLLVILLILFPVITAVAACIVFLGACAFLKE